MKRLMILFVLGTVTLNACGQEKFDNKIIITFADTAGIYLNTRIALANSDFIVKENFNKDTIDTHPKEIDYIRGYLIFRAIISGSTVTLTGVYGLSRITAWGYARLPAGYQRIIYYNGSKTWRSLMNTAIKMRGAISFGKVEKE